MILPTFTIQIGSAERKMSCEIQGTSRKYGKNAGRPYGLGEGCKDSIFLTTGCRLPVDLNVVYIVQ